MSMTVTRKLVIGGAVGAMALLGALGPASAKNGHHRHHFFRFSQPTFVTPTYTGCDYYYSRWKNSGSRFWRAKYFACIG